MEIKSLTIVGASNNVEKFGYRSLKKALEKKIEVYAVNPNKREIQVKLDNGEVRRVHPFETVISVPIATDYVALYIPRRTILGSNILEQIARKGFQNVIVPPDETFSGESITLGGEIRDKLRRIGYEDSHILIDACYLRGI